jgi:hypothetical protein
MSDHASNDQEGIYATFPATHATSTNHICSPTLLVTEIGAPEMKNQHRAQTHKLPNMDHWDRFNMVLVKIK